MRTWLLADERGSVVAETDGAGVATSTFGYGPHGEPVARGLPPRFGFTGAPILKPLALTQMRARTYSHNLGQQLPAGVVRLVVGTRLHRIGHVPVQPVGRAHYPTPPDNGGP